MSKTKLFIYRLLPLVIFLGTWELLLRNDKKMIFYFGLPSTIFQYIISKVSDGTLVTDFLHTFFEALIGFIIGNVFGTVIGLGLWFSNRTFQIAKPYIIAMGSAPVFALAPILIIWFGTGMYSKVMIAAISTFFIALFQAYSGAEAVDDSYLRLMKTFKASKIQVFRKVIAPSSIVWVISAFRMNVGFALLGAFIGEYISSNSGLGHLILVASGLFDISLVLAGVLMMVIIALLLNFIINLLADPIKKFIVRTL
jgi:NitT/TauT family transport system permease protein